MKDKVFAVYIMTSKSKVPLYTGFTGNLALRYWQHREGSLPGFASKYKAKYLLYYELFEDPELAILREKQIKGWVRRKKVALIEKDNPEWRDLGEVLFSTL